MKIVESRDNDLNNISIIRTVGEMDEILSFRHQIDYINYIGLTQRCNTLFNRAQRKARNGDVVDAAAVLAELWEVLHQSRQSIFVPFDSVMESNVVNNEIGYNSSNNPMFNQFEANKSNQTRRKVATMGKFANEKNKDSKMIELTDYELLKIMRNAHLGYINYLITETRNVGKRAEDKIVYLKYQTSANKRFLTMVYQNIENTKNYAKKYQLYDDKLKKELKQLWNQKESEFNNDVKQTQAN